MRENDKEEKVKYEMEEIETINIELEHSVAKLLSENEGLHKEIGHLKKIYKDLDPLAPREKKVKSSTTSDSNTTVLSSTGLKCSTSTCISQSIGNKKNDRISQKPSRNKKNNVEAQPRKVNKLNRVAKPVGDVDVKHSLSNANSEILCASCNKSMFDDVHDKCLLDFVHKENSRSKSAKKHKKQNIWKPTV
ncbi:hypothetical protein Tco_0546441 [Tanacetum coccineum]